MPRRRTKASSRYERLTEPEPEEEEEDGRFDGEYVFRMLNAGTDAYRNIRDAGGPVAALTDYATDYFVCPNPECKVKHYCGRLAYAAASDCGVREQDMGGYTLVYCKACKVAISTHS